jgi:uncharacterized protein (DUF2062 family)/2-polyprenyl-3-methyl-5-hydroxy-6-metoxy-1,4-benzoquinol methylase
VTSAAHPLRLSRFQRLIHVLRTEGGSRGRQAAAVGVGVFVGCLPLWGLHLAICFALGRLLGLNRVKMYVAANISNPILAPLLVVASAQLGRLARRGDVYRAGWQELRSIDPAAFGVDLVVGSVLLGALLGGVAALFTWLLTRPATDVRAFLAAAADRYLPVGVTAWEFARSKLRSDPVYADVVLGGHLPSSGRLLDVGCGQGLLLAALATARAWHAQGAWPPAWPPPADLDLHGIELRSRPVEVARMAVGADATIVRADVREVDLGGFDVLAVVDVLHLLPRSDQDALLTRLAEALRPEGVLLLREADPAAGWRFQLVRAVNFLRGLAQGRWRRFAFRTVPEWERALQRLGLRVARPSDSSTAAFANVLFVAHSNNSNDSKSSNYSNESRQ